MRLAIEYRQQFQQRRGHRHGLLPPLRPQRGRRAELHPAADVRGDPREADRSREVYAEHAGRAGPGDARRRPTAIARACAERVRSTRYSRAQGAPQLKEPSAMRGRVEAATAAARDRRAGGRRPACPSETLVRAARAAGRRCPRASRRTRKIGEAPRAPRRRWPAARRRSTGARARRSRTPRCSRDGHARAPHRAGHRARHLQPPPRGAARRRRPARRYVPLAAPRPGGRRAVEVYNSPLSETGVLGLRVRLLLDYPDALVVWEAQFGDFANGAQVIIDQFIVAARGQVAAAVAGSPCSCRTATRAQGPEHSSARLERFLQLCAEDNIQVCYPTTPAQIFHLLRRQVLRPLAQAAGGDDAQEPAAAARRPARRSTSSPRARSSASSPIRARRAERR